MLIMMKWNVIDYFIWWDSRFYGQRVFNVNSLQLMCVMYYKWLIMFMNNLMYSVFAG